MVSSSLTCKGMANTEAQGSRSNSSIKAIEVFYLEEGKITDCTRAEEGSQHNPELRSLLKMVPRRDAVRSGRAGVDTRAHKRREEGTAQRCRRTGFVTSRDAVMAAP